MDSKASFSGLISAHRAFIMGACIVVIMLFHNDFRVFGSYAWPVRCYGHWGVDVFLFISGFGLYHSLNRAHGAGLVQFYKRRLVRIMPAAVLAGCVLYACGVAGKLGLFGLNLWYMRTLLLLYLLAPLTYHLFSVRSPILVLLGHFVLGMAGVLISVPLLSGASFECQSTVSWTFARLPVFAVGMYVARMDFRLRQIFSPGYVLFACLCLFAALYFHDLRYETQALSNYLHLFPYMLVAIAMPLLLGVLVFIIPANPGVVAHMAAWAGACSLELYLVHEAVFQRMAKISAAPAIKCLCSYALSFAGAWVLKKLVDFLMRIKWSR